MLLYRPIRPVALFSLYLSRYSLVPEGIKYPVYLVPPLHWGCAAKFYGEAAMTEIVELAARSSGRLTGGEMAPNSPCPPWTSPGPPRAISWARRRAQGTQLGIQSCHDPSHALISLPKARMESEIKGLPVVTAEETFKRIAGKRGQKKRSPIGQ